MIYVSSSAEEKLRLDVNNSFTYSVGWMKIVV